MRFTRVVLRLKARNGLPRLSSRQQFPPVESSSTVEELGSFPPECLLPSKTEPVGVTPVGGAGHGEHRREPLAA